MIIAPLLFNPPSYGAETVAFAAAGAKVRADAQMYKGAYIGPGGKIGKTTKAGEDRELAKELRNITEVLVKEWGLQ